MFLCTSDLQPSKEGHLGYHHNRGFQILGLPPSRNYRFQEQTGTKDQPGQWLYLAAYRLRQHRQLSRNQPKDHCIQRIRDSITSSLGLLETYPRRKQRMGHIHLYTAWKEPLL